MQSVKVFLITISLVLAQMASAAKEPSTTSINEILTTAASKLVPGVKVTRYEKSKLPGFYNVIINGQLAMISEDGNYVIVGPVLDLQKDSANWELGSSIMNTYRVERLSEISNPIIYTPEQVRGTVTVFTDIDCGICRKFHNDIPRLLDEGIQVRYIAYPRMGPNSLSFAKAASVWCSSDPKTAMTNAKTGMQVKDPECDHHKIGQHFDLATKLAIRGTPTFIFKNGEVLMGYTPVQNLVKLAIDNYNGEAK